MRKFLAIIALACTLIGCEALQKTDSPLYVGFVYGTAKYIEKAGDTSAQAERAGKIISQAQELKTFFSVGGVTMQALSEEMKSRINDKVESPADRAILYELTDYLVAYVGDRMRSQEGWDYQVVVNKVFDKVIEGASYYVSPSETP